MTVARQTQEVVEVLSEVTPVLRVTQVIVELITDNVPDDEEGGATQPLLIVVT